jgi:Restriction endonuclease BamHI
MDASKQFGTDPPFMAEWETGNISSSHRSMNKLALGVLEGAISGGVLIAPTRDFARYLTDRIGNTRELAPYFRLWQSIKPARGYLAVIAVEHDRTSRRVKRIAKGTSGRALL